ncbi:MAG: hypothetical protein NTU41_11760 [Chloroflexi bacterium]|nr:hypothetical protein [Chloroflexota bacterium]
MKNQYFGDINDYRKYGLIRSLSRVSRLRLLVAWMLTPNDGTGHGRDTKYLSDHQIWSRYDRELYLRLQHLVDSNSVRAVSLVENAGLLANTDYFSATVPDSAAGRSQWASELIHAATGADLVFLDPDKGLEVKSTPYGRKHSSEYLYWREVKALWENKHSVLIYQHFGRVKRSEFVQGMLSELPHHTQLSTVEAFSTPHAVFFLALQPKHAPYHSQLVEELRRKWAGQIWTGSCLLHNMACPN